MIYAPLFATSLIALFMCITPIFWHWGQRNTPALFLIGWTVIGDLCVFMNSIPFGSADITTYWDGRVFCDITSRLHLMASIGCLGSITSISRSLARIMSGKTTIAPTDSEKRIELCAKLFYSVFLPVLELAIYYIFQARRYFILQYTGCSPGPDYSYVNLLGYMIWCPILMIIASYYSGTVHF